MSLEKTNITIYIKRSLLKELNKLINDYIFPNRSMLVNECIEIALPIIYKKIVNLKKNMEARDLPEVFKFLKERGFIIRTGTQPSIKIPLGNIYFNSNNEVILKNE